MTALSSRRCQPIVSGTAALSQQQVRGYLQQVAGWKECDGAIERTFSFKNYHEAMAFVNATAWISHQEDHHPDLQVGYNKCTVRYSTHSVGGLSDNDFICAAKVDALINP